jgi:hypothetical protein
LLTVLSVVTSALFFWRFRDFYTPDSASYVVPAGNMLAGKGFVDSTGYPETERTPGYSLFILPFLWRGVDLKYLVIFQHLLRALIVLATSAFAFRVTKSRIVALLTGVLLCLDLPFLEAANSVMTEMLFTTILAVVLWLLWTDSERQDKPGSRCFASGFLAGASVLIRPVSILFLVPGALYLLTTRGGFKLRAALVFCLAFACLPLVWAARNRSETGDFTVTTISAVNMLLYRAAGALAINDPGDFGGNLEKRQAQLQTQACDDISRLHGADCSQVRMPEKAQYYSQLGERIILTHPVAYAKLALRGDAMMIFGGNLTRFRQMTDTGPRIGMALLLAYSVPVFGLSIVALLTLWKRNRRLFTLVFGVGLYFLVVSGGAEAYSRFRVPIVPLYALAAAMGLQSIARWFTAKKDQTLYSGASTLQPLDGKA